MRWREGSAESVVFPVPGEPEEDGDRAVVVHVRRAVHREDALEREAVVHEREDRLLDLARVEGAADHDLRAGRVEDDERAAAGPVLVGLGRDGRRVQDERLDLHLLELVRRRVDEERLGEERVPRALGDDADGDPVRGVGAREGVDDVDVARAETLGDLVAQPLEGVLRDVGVDVAPPDPILGARLADDELVLRRAAGVDAGVHDQRAAFREAPVAVRERVRVELGRRRMPVDPAADEVDPVLGEALSARHGRDHRCPLVIVCCPTRIRPYRKRARRFPSQSVSSKRRSAAETGPSQRSAPGSVTSPPLRERTATPCSPRGTSV